MKKTVVYSAVMVLALAVLFAGCNKSESTEPSVQTSSESTRSPSRSIDS